MNIKIGDYVKCIDNDKDRKNLTLNKIYKVINVRKSRFPNEYFWVSVINDDDIYDTNFSYRFKKILPLKEMIMFIKKVILLTFLLFSCTPKEGTVVKKEIIYPYHFLKTTFIKNENIVIPYTTISYNNGSQYIIVRYSTYKITTENKIFVSKEIYNKIKVGDFYRNEK